jgi:hypothetical protein
MMQASAMMSGQMDGPVANQSSAQDCDPNSNQQMVMSPSTNSQCVPDLPQQAPHIYQTPHKATYTKQILHQATYVQEILTLPQQPNYTIHTSQAAPTATADFSGREVNTKAITRTIGYPLK